jgi:hypothetical protein
MPALGQTAAIKSHAGMQHTSLYAAQLRHMKQVNMSFSMLCAVCDFETHGHAQGDSRLSTRNIGSHCLRLHTRPLTTGSSAVCSLHNTEHDNVTHLHTIYVVSDHHSCLARQMFPC